MKQTVPRRSLRPIPFLVAALCANGHAATPAPDALPTGGRVTAGAATIAQSGARMDINQTSERAILEWQRFDIGAAAHVNFAQPSSSAIALNRVLAGDASQIFGKLTANGQVWLVNPYGVVFGAGSRVDVGGLVASSLDIADGDFLDGRNVFKRNGAAGKVLNQGMITAADGGLVALLAPEVRNEGVISARLGNVVLAAGERVTLEAGANGRLHVAVDPATISTLVENRHLIVADGGQVVMSAQAADRLYSAVVANSGTVQVRTLENRDGRILLLADMDHGEVQVGGLLDASAPTAPSPLAGEGRGEGANGGFVETSAATVSLAAEHRVTTLAANGNTGTWLIDPNDYTIAAAGGNITGAQLAADLAGSNIAISTATQGTAGGNGDIFVNDAVSWSANKLTLSAGRNIAINANLNGSGTASLALEYGQSAVAAGNTADYSLGNGAKVYLPAGANFSTKLGSNGATTTYTVITSLGVAGDAGTTTLQGMKNNPSGKYALGSDIDASATAGVEWNAGSGFAPIGTGWDASTAFTGSFHGLNHTITGLTIARPASDYIGLFGSVVGGTVRDTIIKNSSIDGGSYVGGLIGYLVSGTVSNVYAQNGNVHGNAWCSASGCSTGGLIGTFDDGILTNSHTSGSVSGPSFVGGLVGELVGWVGSATITDSYASGTVTGGGGWTGALVGVRDGGTVSNSYHDIDNTLINGNAVIPGGLFAAQLQDWLSHGMTLDISRYAATLPLVGGYYQIGSLAGMKDFHAFAGQAGYKFRLTSDIDLATLPSYQVGFNGTEFDGANHVLLNTGATPFSSVSAASTLHNIGIKGNNINGSGLAATNDGTISNSYFVGSVVANAFTGFDSVGGLVGQNNGTISNSYCAGSVTSNGWHIGGLVGNNYGTIGVSYAAANVTGHSTVGGLAGANFGTINNSYATGSAVGTSGGYVGGLAGANFGGTINSSYATGHVTSAAGNVGGLVGGWGMWGVHVTNNSYWDTQTSGQGVSAGGTGKTTAQMKQQAAFAGWDFTNTWRIYTGQSYPVLRALQSNFTVTANNAIKTYDGTAWSAGNGVSYSADGAPLTGAVTYSGTSQGATNTGSYSITPGGLALNRTSQQDYQSWGDDILFTDGTLTVNKAPLTITANADGKTYDGNAYAGGNGVAYSGFVNGETAAVLGGALAYGGDSQGAANTGSYVITPSGRTSGNYTISFVDGVLTIGKAPLTITANAASKTYDGTPYAGGNGVAYSGFVNGETAAVLGGALAYGGNAQGAVNAGNYVITPSGRTAGNYTISFVNGVLTISPISPVAPAQTASDNRPDGGTLARVQERRIEAFMPRTPDAAVGPMTLAAARPPLDVRTDFIALPAER